MLYAALLVNLGPRHCERVIPIMEDYLEPWCTGEKWQKGCQAAAYLLPRAIRLFITSVPPRSPDSKHQKGNLSGSPRVQEKERKGTKFRKRQDKGPKNKFHKPVQLHLSRKGRKKVHKGHNICHKADKTSVRAQDEPAPLVNGGLPALGLALTGLKKKKQVNQ